MRTEVYAHPVSFRTDPAGQAARLAGAGVDRVRLAFAYHSGRWLLSTSAPASVADLDGGLWFAPVPPLRGRLRPTVVADLAGGAATALRAVGIEVSAWLVGLHQSALATAHPDLALRNAFDHRYRHALCPSRAEVVDHAAALAGGAAAVPGVTGLDLEAFGYLGWAHQGAHEKVGVPLRPVDRWLLSLCLCPGCVTVLAAAGVDPAELGGRIRTALENQLARPRPAAPALAEDAATALGPALHDTVLAVRSAVVRRLVSTAVQAADDTPASLRVTADPYATDGRAGGDLAGLGALTGALTVSNLHGDTAALAADLAAARPWATTLTGAWNGAHPPDAAYAAALTAGTDVLALYAYDLMPADRLTWLRRAVPDREEVRAG